MSREVDDAAVSNVADADKAEGTVADEAKITTKRTGHPMPIKRGRSRTKKANAYLQTCVLTAGREATGRKNATNDDAKMAG